MNTTTRDSFIGSVCGTIVGLIIISFLLFITGCGHPERYGCNINADGTYVCLDGSEGSLPTDDDNRCTVTDTDAGALIACADGSEVEIFDGQDGDDGSTVIVVCHKTKKGVRVCTQRRYQDA